MKKQYELIEALDAENMNKMLHHEKENIDPQSYLIGSPMSIVKYILKTDLKEYKLVKKDAHDSIASV